MTNGAFHILVSIRMAAGAVLTAIVTTVRSANAVMTTFCRMFSWGRKNIWCFSNNRSCMIDTEKMKNKKASVSNHWLFHAVIYHPLQKWKMSYMSKPRQSLASPAIASGVQQTPELCPGPKLLLSWPQADTQEDPRWILGAARLLMLAPLWHVLHPSASPGMSQHNGDI